jgi:TRAP-type C4-dicarboxylate transport system permease small subunit
MRFDPNRNIHPQKRDELLARPEIKQPILTMDIVSGAFFAATLVYLWMVSADILGKSAPTGDGFPIWYILVFLAVSMVPVMILMAAAVFALRGRIVDLALARYAEESKAP